MTKDEIYAIKDTYGYRGSKTEYHQGSNNSMWFYRDSDRISQFFEEKESDLVRDMKSKRMC